MGDIKIFLSNVRSLQANFDEMLLNSHSLFPNDNIDIFALTETLVSRENFSKYIIKGYSQVIQDRTNSRSGGVAFYIKETIQYDVMELIGSTFNGLSITLKHNNKQLRLILIYRFCTSLKIIFLTELEKFIISSSTPVLLLGNFNINLLSQNDSSSLLNLFYNNVFLSLVNEFTRVGF